jgi:hypothetical protein
MAGLSCRPSIDTVVERVISMIAVYGSPGQEPGDDEFDREPARLAYGLG